MDTPDTYAARAEAMLAEATTTEDRATEVRKMAARCAQANATLAQTAATLALLEGLGPLVACVQLPVGAANAGGKASLRVMATNGFA